MTHFAERLVSKPGFMSDDVDFVSVQRGWILQCHRILEGGASVDTWCTLDPETEIHQSMTSLSAPGTSQCPVARHSGN